MKRLLAIVEIEEDEIPTDKPASISRVDQFLAINPDTFITHWNEGIIAREKWEQFCENFFQILIKSGVIDETGLHVDEYTPGSICRFIVNNKDILPETFRESALGMMVIAAVKTGAKTIKKGKDIEVNWDAINAHAGPMTEAVLNRMVMKPERADMLLPVFTKYFTIPPVPPLHPSAPQFSDN